MVPHHPIHCQVGCYLWFPGWPCQMKARWQLSLLEDITDGPQEGLPDNYAFAKVSTSSNFPAETPPWNKNTVHISMSCVKTESFGYTVKPHNEWLVFTWYYLTISSSATLFFFCLQWLDWLSGHDSEQTLADSEGQRSLVCYSSWGSQRI